MAIFFFLVDLRNFFLYHFIIRSVGQNLYRRFSFKKENRLKKTRTFFAFFSQIIRSIDRLIAHFVLKKINQNIDIWMFSVVAIVLFVKMKQ